MEDSLKRLQRVRQTNRSSANLASSSANYMSDDDKIRLQLSLDIKELRKQLEEKFDGYKSDTSLNILNNLIDEINNTLSKQQQNQNLNQNENFDKAANSNFLVIEENETA
jgi:hypothetical protein